MHDFPFRRAAAVWLRLLLPAAVSAALAAAAVRRFGGDAVYAVGEGPSLLSWLTPSALFCLLAMAAGTSVFAPVLLGLGCALDGAAFGAVFALAAEGRLLASSRAALWLCVPAILLRTGLCAVIRAGSERTITACGTGDEKAFRSALRAGCAVSLTCSGCVLAASLMLRLAAGGWGGFPRML